MNILKYIYIYSFSILPFGRANVIYSIYIRIAGVDPVLRASPWPCRGGAFIEHSGSILAASWQHSGSILAGAGSGARSEPRRRGEQREGKERKGEERRGKERRGEERRGKGRNKNRIRERQCFFLLLVKRDDRMKRS